MILYIDDLLNEINILNWYRGEAAKRGNLDADVVQTDSDKQDAMLLLIRKAVTDILLLLNSGGVKFTCEYTDDCLRFALSPVREGKEYLLDILKEAMRQYIVYEVRRLWMKEVQPAWADASIREELRMNMLSAFRGAGGGEKIRRRATNLGGI